MSSRRRTSPGSADGATEAPAAASSPASTAGSGAPDGDEWNPDATPYVEGYDVAEDAVPPMVGVGVPAVVAVVVTRNPGPWLETCLGSIDAQEYANLTTLVVDAGSLVDPTQRVAEVLPKAFVKRIAEEGFGAGANAALGTIEGAAFFLFCHDDVELGPGAVQAMVEEAFRQNAGIVGAKLVDWDDPEHLRSVGGSIDKFGFSWPIAELNELDQEQHDAVREVFVVSTAAMLVRSDLFADLGGFATDIDGSGEDLDLCWRARVAGARTVVMPAAKVRHRERSEVGDPTGRSHRLALRHQARIMLACYSPMHLLRVGPQAFLLALLDLVASLVRGRVNLAGDVASAIGWNVVHLPSTLRLRGRVKRSRRTPDSEIRRLQIKGSARFLQFLRRVASGNRTVAATWAAATRTLSGGDDESPDGLWPALVVVVAGALLLVGSRGLISGGVPAVRDMVPLGDPSRLLSEWWTGWRSTGLGGAAGAPTINLVAALLTWVTFGSEGFVRTALVLAPLALGAVSTWRVLAGSASAPARAAAVLAYLVNPVPYNALAEGRWQAVVVYGAVPSILGRIARAGAWAPFDRAEPPPGSVQRQIVGMGLLLAAASTIAPVVNLVAGGLCLLVVLVLTGTRADGSPGRALLVTGGGLGLSFALHLPWALSVLTSSNRWAVLTGSSPSRGATPDLAHAAMFDTGSHGGVIVFGLLFAAAVALLISTGERFRWSLVAAAMVTASLAAVVLAGRLAPGVALPSPEVLLAAGATGIALALALGVDAFRSEVVGGAFGARQVLSLLAAVAVAVSSLPFLVDVVDGRWGASPSDLRTGLAPIGGRGDVPADRTLWIGDGDVVAAAGWDLGGGMKFSLTDGLRTSVASIFPQGAGPGERALRAVLTDASSGGPTGGTSRLGASLAAFGVRYVVVQERLAPVPYGATRSPIDPVLAARLDQQVDLARVAVAPGVLVYENQAPAAIRASAEPADVEGLRTVGSVADAVTAGLAAAPWRVTGTPSRLEGRLPADQELLALSTRDAGWKLTVGDDDAVAAKAFGGWAGRYPTGAGGPSTLAYSTPATQVLAHLLQLGVLLTLPWFRRRRVSEFRVRLARSRSEREAR